MTDSRHDGRRDGDDLITFRELLDRAHQEGLTKVETKVLQLPTKDNGDTTIVQASVETKRGTFFGTGDASPDTVNPEVAIHAVRVAETRAIARALRFALNVGETAREELGGGQRDTRRERFKQSLQPRHAAPESRQQDRGRDREERRDGRDASNDNGRGRDERARQPERRSSTDERNPNPADSDLAMTSAQKKFCFRLAYESGATGDDATALVLRHLGVDRLEYATRTQASRAIDTLKRLGGGQSAPHNGAPDHRPSGQNGHHNGSGSNGHAPRA